MKKGKQTSVGKLFYLDRNDYPKLFLNLAADEQAMLQASLLMLNKLNHSSSRTKHILKPISILSLSQGQRKFWVEYLKSLRGSEGLSFKNTCMIVTRSLRIWTNLQQRDFLNESKGFPVILGTSKDYFKKNYLEMYVCRDVAENKTVFVNRLVFDRLATEI